jgi:hypothetical protein
MEALITQTADRHAPNWEFCAWDVPRAVDAGCPSLRAAGDDGRRGSLHILAMSGDRLDKDRDERCRNIVAQPGMIFSVAPGVIRAVSLPPSVGTSGSSSPCNTRVGARIVFNRSTPAPARQDREHLPADPDRIVRAVERAFDPGAQLLFRGRIAGTVDDAIDVPNWIDASRSLPGGRVAASMAAAAGLARGSFGSLLVDMIDRRLRVLAPCLAAMICAIIPSHRRADGMSPLRRRERHQPDGVL